MADRHIISVVIPVFRNEKSVSLTHAALIQLFDFYLNNKYQLELIFVDDGSDDHSLQELIKIQRADSRVKVIGLTPYFGQAAAAEAGFRAATGDALIAMSADLQDPVDLIAQMISHFEGGSDVVVCYRQDRDDGLIAKLFSNITYGILRITYPQIPKGGFDYLLFTRRVLQTILTYGLKGKFFQTEIAWSGYPISFIPYSRKRRVHGKSQYTFGKKLKVFIDAVLDASYLPIRIISLAGVFLSILGFIYAGVVVNAWFFNKTPFTGYAPIIISVLVVGGLNILLLGIVGEYIWRIYDHVRGKPNYVIKDIYQ